MDDFAGVSTPLPEYRRYLQDLELVKALHGGTNAMRAAGKRYLPQEDGETPVSYQNRMKRSVLTNFYTRTLEKLAGQVFAEDLEPSNDLPDAVYELLQNIDLEQHSASQFMRRVFYTAMHKGLCHVLVDYPQVQGQTLADHRQAGARPYWVLLDPERVIGWRFESVQGRQVLTQLRILEQVQVPEGRFGVQTVERVRLYEPGSCRIFQQDEDDWKQVDSFSFPDVIPLVTLMLGQKTTDMTALPCLQGLAELNCQHWQSASDQRNILHYARMITFFGKCLDMDEGGNPVFGANRLIHTTDANGDLRVVEHSGAGIEAGRNDLKDLESAMALFGLQLLLPRVSGQTATQNAIEKGEADSALLAWARMLGSAIQALLAHTCNWLRIEPMGELVPYTGFAAAFNNTDAATLVEGYKAGLLPRELVIGELKERGLIHTDYDMAELARMFEDDARSTATMQTGLV